LFTDWNKPGLNRRPLAALNRDTKDVFITLQRMEDPGDLFYKRRTTAGGCHRLLFPKGLHHGVVSAGARHPARPRSTPNKVATALRWFRAAGRLIPRIHAWRLYSARRGCRIRASPGGRFASCRQRAIHRCGQIPLGGSGNHYFAARETRTRRSCASRSRPGGSGPATEQEKFLFYPAWRNFKTPLQVTFKQRERHPSLPEQHRHG